MLITPVTAVPRVGQSQLSLLGLRPPAAGTPAFPTSLRFGQVCRILVAFIPHTRQAVVGKLLWAPGFDPMIQGPGSHENEKHSYQATLSR